MQLTVENEMKVSRVHGKPMGEGKGGKVLHVGGEHGATVTKTLARLSWMAGHSERDGGLRLEVPKLASLAGANRAQLAVLKEAKVTAGLREGVTGVTCLASVRLPSPRLTAAPIVLARGPGFQEERTLRQEWGSPLNPDILTVGDEGGIYSW